MVRLDGRVQEDEQLYLTSQYLEASAAAGTISHPLNNHTVWLSAEHKRAAVQRACRAQPCKRENV
jgi:hypothetical protein